MTTLYLDCETYSETPIQAGTYRYTADVEVMLITWAVDDGEVVCEGAEPSTDLLSAVADADIVVAHNAMFDRNALRSTLAVPLHKWRCSMVRAMAHALPGGLAKLCDVMGLPPELWKLDGDKKLINLFCKPRPANQKLRRATKDTHPQEWAQFVEYAKQDVRAMREVWKRLPTWNYDDREIELWHLDQIINDRGFCVDLDLVDAAQRAAEREQAALAERTREETAGEVAAATQRDVLLQHLLDAYGLQIPNLQKATLEKLLEDPGLAEGIRVLLEIRLDSSSTSVAKYKVLAAGHTGGRMRGTIQFDGAGRTRRAAGRTFQPQNLPRPTVEQWEIDHGIDLMKMDALHLVFDRPMAVIASCVRGAIVAPPGKKLVVADLSNIEGRVAAWLAGEDWKIRAFEDFDAGLGADLYKVAYARSFNIDPADVTKPQRQVGKVQELALQYQGRVGAFVTFAAAYGIDLEELAVLVQKAAPLDVLAASEEFLLWWRRQGNDQFGLSDAAFIACDVLTRLWREAHDAISSYWGEIENACFKAMANPGVKVPCRRCYVVRSGAWLRIVLPSGRSLCYPSPQVTDGKLTYMGVNQYSRKWCRLSTYGGKLFENMCQSVARDVLYDSMPGVEDLGYQIVLHVHDELITEAPDIDRYSAQDLAAQMAAGHEWTEGLPLAAAGFETYRYFKEQ